VYNLITVIHVKNWISMFSSVMKDLFRKSVVNMRITLYNKVPDHIKILDKNKSFKRELKFFPLHLAFYSVDENIPY
jgi:hypothetical protein